MSRNPADCPTSGRDHRWVAHSYSTRCEYCGMDLDEYLSYQDNQQFIQWLWMYEPYWRSEHFSFMNRLYAAYRAGFRAGSEHAAASSRTNTEDNEDALLSGL